MTPEVKAERERAGRIRGHLLARERQIREAERVEAALHRRHERMHAQDVRVAERLAVRDRAREAKRVARRSDRALAREALGAELIQCLRDLGHVATPEQVRRRFGRISKQRISEAMVVLVAAGDVLPVGRVWALMTGPGAESNVRAHPDCPPALRRLLYP